MDRGRGESKGPLDALGRSESAKKEEWLEVGNLRDRSRVLLEK